MNRSFYRRSAVALPVAFLLLASLGCGSAGNPVPTATSDETVWDMIRMNDHPVGYQSLTLRRLTEGGQSLQDARATTVLNLQRFGETTRQQMNLASRESADGQVTSLEASMESGSGVVQTVARRHEDQLLFETRSGSQVRRWSLKLPPECGGYFAVEWSLRNEPLRPGQGRQLHAVLPVVDQVARITLTAGQIEAVRLLDAKRNLLRIDQEILLHDGSRIKGVAWTTDDGEVIKTEITSLQQVTYRVDRETALAATEIGGFDLGRFSTVHIAEPLPVTDATQQIRYRVTLTNEDPAQYFLNTPGQRVVSVNAHTADVSVTALQPGDAPAVNDDPPTAADRDPAAMIQSDDPLIRALAEQIRPAEPGTWAQALATEKLVYETVADKNLGTAFASAAEVAASRAGDCTEHAVLLAALCRAQGIPARVLVGLVYTAAEQGFAFHMWNEVWINDGWIPLDGSAARGGTSPTYLVLGRSNLAGGDAMIAMLPVIKVMGQLSIEVLEIRDAPVGTEDSAAQP